MPLQGHQDRAELAAASKSKLVDAQILQRRRRDGRQVHDAA
jgi:hypothetical protein